MSTDYRLSDEHLARLARALGHPARIAILKFLAAQDGCFFGDIHEVLPIAKATVSQHLSQLKDAGLIRGEIFPPKVKYCIDPQGWEQASKMLCQFMTNSKLKATDEKCCAK